MSNFLTRPLAAGGSWWRRQSRRRKIVFAVLVAGIIIFLLRKGGTGGGTLVEIVKRQDLIRSVSANGSVVSSTDLSLGFEQSKMVASIKVSVGDTVKKGDVLASLSNGTERAALVSAKGSLLAAQARYNKVIQGTSSEEIKLAQTQLDNATTTQNNLVANALRKLYSDDLVADPQGTTTDLAPIISGNYNGTEEGEYRISFDGTSTETFIHTGLEKGMGQVSDLPKPLGTKGLLIRFPQTSYSPTSSWKILIPSKSGADYTTNLNAYQAALASRDAAIAEAKAELDLKRATARQPDIDAALADMVTAQAGVDTANAALEKTILRAPADGTVTAVNVKVGEIPQVGDAAIVIQDISNLYLEANINESDIKSVAVGQPVTVTFDAFSGDVYHANVSSIDPAATIENNVVNYKIKALLTDTDAIRPGMTADMTIQTAQVANVLVLPSRVIKTKDNRESVMLIVDARRNKAVSQPVTTGLIGDGDLVEIKSGLKEGDRVLWTPAK